MELQFVFESSRVCSKLNQRWSDASERHTGKGSRGERASVRSALLLILAHGIEALNIFSSSRAPLRSSSMQMGPLPGGVLPGREVCAAVAAAAEGRAARSFTLYLPVWHR
jgi:hypothetical protein